MKYGDQIYVAGHTGMVGSAIVRRLHEDGFANLLLPPRQFLDLTDAHAVDDFFAAHTPAYVFLAAAHVGGIQANIDAPADFIESNLRIQTNVIRAAWFHGCKKLLFLGSSCIYPRDAAQPITEDALLTGPLEPTNKPYAVAKIAGITLLEAMRAQRGFESVTLMPCNLYGPGDHFGPRSHVIPALLRHFHEARRLAAPAVTIWGTGNPYREFLHVDDVARAAVLAMRHPHAPPICNVGSGVDLQIRTLARVVAEVVGFEGMIVFDAGKPDGVPRKLLDSRIIRSLGWRDTILLRAGLEETYRWFCAQPPDVPLPR